MLAVDIKIEKKLYITLELLQISLLMCAFSYDS